MLFAQLAALATTTALLIAGCGGSSKTGSTAASANGSTTTVTTTAAATTTTTASTATTAASSAQSSVNTKPVTLAGGQPLTRAQLLTQGDAICLRLNNELNASPVTSPAEFSRALPQAAAYEQGELSELEKLVPPPSLAKDWQQILTDTREWAEYSAKLGETAQVQAGHFNIHIPLLDALSRVHEQLASIAKSMGFKQCSIA